MWDVKEQNFNMKEKAPLMPLNKYAPHLYKTFSIPLAVSEGCSIKTIILEVVLYPI